MNPHYIFTIPHANQNPTRSQTYTTYFFGKPILVTVTSTPAVARQWVYNLRNNHPDRFDNANLVVGLGVQWTPQTRRNPNPPTVATLQLSVGRNCLIFQLSHANNVPLTLHRLFEDERVTFVGVHNGTDQSRLLQSWAQLEVWDLVDLAMEEGYGNRSMEGICSEVLGFHGVSKPTHIGRSNWDNFYLSVDQVQYAAIDAYVSYLLGVHFGYPKNYDDDDEEEEDEDEYYDDDEVYDNGYLDYEDYTNPYHYDSNWNYVGY